MRSITDSRAFEMQVEKRLQDASLKYLKEVVIGATTADFLITTHSGHRIMLEAKDWVGTDANRKRAIDQISLYKKLSSADEVIMVIAKGKASRKAGAIVIPISDLIQTLDQVTAGLKKLGRQPAPIETRPLPKRTVFASMPFSSQYDDTFLVAIQPAALALDAVADRVDHSGHAGDLVGQIKEMIKAAKVVVADLSKSRPNVCHEVGFAEALGQPVIQICSSPMKSLPFNVRNNRTIAYSIGQTAKLRTRLQEELSKVI